MLPHILSPPVTQTLLPWRVRHLLNTPRRDEEGGERRQLEELRARNIGAPLHEEETEGSDVSHVGIMKSTHHVVTLLHTLTSSHEETAFNYTVHHVHCQPFYLRV